MLLAATTTACSTKSASEIDTSEMNARMRAIATGDGNTRVEVSLRDPSALLTFRQLTADDKLEASVAGETKQRVEHSLLGSVTYSATFGTDAAETEVRVSLSRSNGTNARDSSVRMPAPFTLQPLANESFSRAAPLTLRWSSAPSPDPLNLEISGECIESYSADLGTGSSSFTVPAGALVKRVDQEEGRAISDECAITLTVTRAREGSVDRAFHGGSFTAEQTRTVNAQSVP
ncbi:MAG: hypothetical protein ACOX6T_15935 [Myxococcales bacterium]|jgi:hypothetical protein